MPVGPWELAIILLIVIIIFGVGKLPQIGGALGQGIREFRTSATGPDDDKDNDTKSIEASRKTDDRVVVVSEADRKNNDRVTVVKENEEI